MTVVGTLCEMATKRGLHLLKIHTIYALTLEYHFRAPRMASWRSGDAADCKSVYTGSIPVLASI